MMSNKLCSFCEEQVKAPLCEVIRPGRQSWHSDSITNATTRYFLICTEEKQSRLTSRESRASASLDISEVMQSVFQTADPISCSLEQGARPWVYCSVKQASKGRLEDCYLCETAYESLEYSLNYSDLLSVALLEFRYEAVSVHYDDVASLKMHLIHLKPKTRGDKGRRPASVSFSRNFNHFINDSGPVQFQRKKTFERCQKWLDMCRRDHTCDTAITTSSLGAQKLPTRLLYIEPSRSDHPSSQSDPVVRLVETSKLKEDSVEYATLSYCWGYENYASILKSCNYDQFCRKVPFSILPRTVRDAVKVVLGMNLKYLWVDAVCIKQDSVDDWSREVASMATVYSCGLINIAATAARNCSEGLFIQDIMSTQQLITLGWSKLPPERDLWSLDGGDGSIALYEESITGAPLMRRGWAFQEMALAPRTIHFAKNFLWWECRQSTIEEDGTCLTASHQPPNQFMDASWESLVEHYALTRLTVVTDRLVAFAGIAEVYAHRHGYKPDDYIAGLWRDDLPDQLLWYVDGCWQRSGPSYVAPSWSWASVQPRSKSNLVEEVISMKFVSEVVEVSEYHPELRVFNPQVSRRGESFFGQIDKGSLELECFLHEMTYRPTYRPTDASLEIAGPSVKVKNSKVQDRFRVFIDEDNFDNSVRGRAQGSISGYFVPVLLDKQGGIWGLLLKSLKPQGRQGRLLKRIGVARSGKYKHEPWWWSHDGNGFKSLGIGASDGLSGKKSSITLV